MKKILSIFLMLAMGVSLSACVKEEEKTIVYADIVSAGNSEYSIVMSAEATDAVKSLAAEVSNRIEELTDIKLERKTDNIEKYPETQYEILVGLSEREATAACLDSLDVIGYKIEFTDGKLIIIASNDYMLEKAVDTLFE